MKRKRFCFLRKMTAMLLAFAMMLQTLIPVSRHASATEQNVPRSNEDITVYMTFEGYNLGQGFYIEPTSLTLPAGSTAEDATRILLDQEGQGFTSMGNGATFFLDRVENFDTGIVNPPAFITETLGAGSGDGSLGSFDYTFSSGWMITVNHEIINVSAGARVLDDQDVIRWQFTVQGFGADLGIDSGWGQEILYTHADKTELIQALFTYEVPATLVHEALSVIIDPLATEEEIASILVAIRASQESGDGNGEEPGDGNGEEPELPEIELPVVDDGSMDISGYLAETLDLLIQSTPAPQFSVIGGEWTVLSLARANHPVPDGYFESYLGHIHQMVQDAGGILHHIRRTDYSRLIVALNAVGEDATDVAGHDLTARILTLDDVARQGINGPIWALIALSSIDFEDIVELEAVQQQYIDFILSRELANGGWALSGSHADPDITAMALYALAPHVSGTNAAIDLAIDRALTRLSELQLPNGGFASWGTQNSQSNSQVIIALTSLGIDPVTDSRFVVNGNNPLTALLTFYVPGGGFRHISTGDLDGMATEQGAMALVAYDRFIRGENPLFDMRDVNMELGDPTVPEPTPKPMPEPTPKPEEPSITTPEVDNTTQESDDATDGETDNNEEAGSRDNQAIENNNRTRTRMSNRSSFNDDVVMTMLSVRELFRGDGVDSIPDNMRGVAVIIDDIPEGTMLVFNEEINLYFSEEMTDDHGQPTYLLMVDVEISDEDLMNPANYSVVVDKKAEEIIFGDTNGSGIVNAQDALNVITAWTREDELMTERQILTMNVNFDSRVDLSDALAIMERFISHREFTIIENE